MIFHWRLATAQGGIAALHERRQGKKLYTDEAELRTAGEQIVTKYRVRGLLPLRCHVSRQQRYI